MGPGFRIFSCHSYLASLFYSKPICDSANQRIAGFEHFNEKKYWAVRDDIGLMW